MFPLATSATNYMTSYRLWKYALLVAIVTEVLLLTLALDFTPYSLGSLRSVFKFSRDHYVNASELSFLRSSEPKSTTQTQDNIDTAFLSTTIPRAAHVSGFTVLDNVYLKNGTFFLLTSNQSFFPPRRELLSRPFDLGTPNMEATDEVQCSFLKFIPHSCQRLTCNLQELQFITPENRREVLGEFATRLQGLTVIVYDTPQFMHVSKIHLVSWRRDVH